MRNNEPEFTRHFLYLLNFIVYSNEYIKNDQINVHSLNSSKLVHNKVYNLYFFEIQLTLIGLKHNTMNLSLMQVNKENRISLVEPNYPQYKHNYNFVKV